MKSECEQRWIWFLIGIGTNINSSCRGRPKSTNCEMASYENSIWKYSKSVFLFQWPSTSVRAIQPISYKGCAWSRQVVAFTVSKWKQKQQEQRESLLPIVWVQMAKVDLRVNRSVAQRNPRKPPQTFPNAFRTKLHFLNYKFKDSAVWRSCRRAQPGYAFTTEMRTERRQSETVSDWDHRTAAPLSPTAKPELCQLV